MAHLTQMFFVNNVRTFFPSFFAQKKVLEIGSLNVNGSVRGYFTDCDYHGIDVGEGPGVDEVCMGENFAGKALDFDVLISTEVFEHTANWDTIFLNMLRMMKSDGLIVFTCASEGRTQHGTSLIHPESSPLTSGTSDYYRNLTESDFKKAFKLKYWFSEFTFFRDEEDLYFVGIGRSEANARTKFGHFKNSYDDYLYKKKIIGLPHQFIFPAS